MPSTTAPPTSVSTTESSLPPTDSTVTGSRGLTVSVPPEGVITSAETGESFSAGAPVSLGADCGAVEVHPVSVATIRTRTTNPVCRVEAIIVPSRQWVGSADEDSDSQGTQVIRWKIRADNEKRGFDGQA